MSNVHTRHSRARAYIPQMFHRYGDKALEKLVPQSQTEALFKAALSKADTEIAELKKDKEHDRELRQAELSAMHKIEDEIKQQVLCMYVYVNVCMPCVLVCVHVRLCAMRMHFLYVRVWLIACVCMYACVRACGRGLKRTMLVHAFVCVCIYI